LGSRSHLELHRREIIERLMNALPHVNYIEPVFDLAEGIIKIAVLTVIDVLLLRSSPLTE
jgi:hypothetical protein